MTRRIQAGDVGLDVLEAGAEQPDKLLLVHGFTGAKEDFADHLDALALAGWHVVAPDHRGHGTSDKPAGQSSYSLALMAGDMVAVADALGWERFALLGHSMGGMVVQHMVLSDADRIRALVLMDTSHACPDGLDPDTIALGREVVAQGGLELLIELQEAQGVDPLATPAHRRMLAERPGYAEFGRRNTLNASADMWQAIVAEIVDQADRLDALHSVAVPTLVIVGDQDAPFMAHSERMAKAIAGAQLAVIADAGHSPQFEAPAAWFDALTRFLDEVRT